MTPRYFIDRPIFTFVISAFILIGGLIAFRVLPISLYPEILPPQVWVRASYPGASSEVVAETVATPLEQSINGVEKLLYVRSSSSSSGQLSVLATFEIGSDPDLAVVNVQNRVQATLPLLPEEVRRQGIIVEKMSLTPLMVVVMESPDNSRDALFVSNYALINVVNELR